MQLLLKTIWIFLTSIYTVHFTAVDGTDKSFAAFSGKKILLVNIASGSAYVSQLSKLQELYAQYQDSLVIVAFPSNSFGTETRTDEQIRQFCQNNYNVSFTIAQKGTVAGSGRLPVYDWLANQQENGVANILIAADFQKVLIDKTGDIIGIYAGEVDPLDNTIKNAIENN